MAHLHVRFREDRAVNKKKDNVTMQTDEAYIYDKQVPGWENGSFMWTHPVPKYWTHPATSYCPRRIILQLLHHFL